nr:DUF134 domain-containing protein [Bacteroidota bacterium]
MSRPKSNRIVHEPPVYTAFKPIGVRGPGLVQVLLSLDEFEAFRLADQLGFSHAEAAEEMEISRPTFTRLIEGARGKVADFIINGKFLKIEGGRVHFRKNIFQCRDCGHMFKCDFKNEMTHCPMCHSSSLINHAGGFGHGKCCEFKG